MAPPIPPKNLKQHRLFKIAPGLLATYSEQEIIDTPVAWAVFRFRVKDHFKETRSTFTGLCGHLHVVKIGVNGENVVCLLIVVRPRLLYQFIFFTNSSFAVHEEHLRLDTRLQTTRTRAFILFA